MHPPADELLLSPEGSTGTLIYQDSRVCLLREGNTARLFYRSASAAGAVGHAQGESLLQALRVVETQTVQQLCLHVNSSGANFREPMAGLFYLNAILEALWQCRIRGLYIRVLVSGWLYGGIAMAIASVAQEVVLSPTATMGLLGHRVRGEGQTEQSLIPTVGFQPEHLNLGRCQ
jgi:acetyl-CoA carboxylase beta subunit